MKGIRKQDFLILISLPKSALDDNRVYKVFKHRNDYKHYWFPVWNSFVTETRRGSAREGDPLNYHPLPGDRLNWHTLLNQWKNRKFTWSIIKQNVGYARNWQHNWMNQYICPVFPMDMFHRVLRLLTTNYLYGFIIRLYLLQFLTQCFVCPLLFSFSCWSRLFLVSH